MLDQKPPASGKRSKGSDKPSAAGATPREPLFSAESVAHAHAERERWESTTVAKAIKRMPEQPAETTTQSGMPINRIYTPDDTSQLDYMRDLGYPGEYPYTRGAQPTMYRAKPWTMRMFAGFGTAEETNERFHYLLEHGQTGLSVAFDMATLYGYDHDHPMALGEFGKCGVAISSLADMEILFSGIPLDKITTSMTINSPAPAIWAMYIAAAEKQGVSMDKLGGTLQNDILKEYIAQ
ncbi:MAG TPA: methylmalonyl-CoA mutase family protein, partial [Ktedonobacterales bacterium]